MLHYMTSFAVPLASVHFPNCDDLNHSLRELFLKKETGGPKYANPSPFTHRNEALFESRFDLFDWPDPEVSRLRDFCWAAVYRLIADLTSVELASLSRLHIAHSSWFHITRSGGYFGIHNHPMSAWSGVYMVCQEGDEGNKDSGLLTLVNPHAPQAMYLDPANHQLKQPYSMGNLTFRLKPGQLLLFPSWLMHEVTPFTPGASGLRVTVAFNTWFRQH